MKGGAYFSWVKAGLDAWSLGAEASVVAGLRVSRIAMGGAIGLEEAQLMVSEKMQAVLELQTDAITGRLGSTPLSGIQGTLRLYHRKVAANRQRLTRRS